MNERPMLPALLRVESACDYSGLTRTRLFEFLKQGKLTAKKSGRQTLIDRVSLDELLASLPTWKPRMEKNEAA